MSISNATEANILGLYFTAVAIANIADNAAGTPETNIHMALATGDPGDAGTMATTETVYASYARTNVARSGSGWTVTVGSVSPDADIDFPAGTTGGGDTVTHGSAGKTGGGAADIYWSGTVTPNIVTGDGVTPRLTTASTFTLD
jgi:hypothetical protein